MCVCVCVCVCACVCVCVCVAVFCLPVCLPVCFFLSLFCVYSVCGRKPKNSPVHMKLGVKKSEKIIFIDKKTSFSRTLSVYNKSLRKFSIRSVYHNLATSNAQVTRLLQEIHTGKS